MLRYGELSTVFTLKKIGELSPQVYEVIISEEMVNVEDIITTAAVTGLWIATSVV